MNNKVIQQSEQILRRDDLKIIKKGLAKKFILMLKYTYVREGIRRGKATLRTPTSKGNRGHREERKRKELRPL